MKEDRNIGCVIGRNRRWQKRIEQQLLNGFIWLDAKLNEVIRRQMATAEEFKANIDGVKDAVAKTADRVVAAINKRSPLTQDQMDAANQEVSDIHTALDAIAPDQPAAVPPADGGTPAAS